MNIEDIVDRLRTRAYIRRSITTRKSVQENQPDRIAELLDEAASVIAKLEGQLAFRIDAVMKYQAENEALKADLLKYDRLAWDDLNKGSSERTMIGSGELPSSKEYLKHSKCGY